MNKIIAEWIENVLKYPTNEIFFQVYGKEKTEKRLQGICEEVYRFCFPEGKKNALGDLRQSYREFEVAYLQGFEGMKPEYITKVKDAFLSDVRYAITTLDNMFKKDPLLQNYYSQWKKKFADINSAVYDMTKDYI